MSDTMQERQKKFIRWGLLLLVSVVIAANYYAYDAMSSIKSVLQTELGISSTDYGLLVSFYGFPNTFLLMTVFGGIFLDRFGIRKTGFLFTLFCALGVFITAYGASDFFRSGGIGYSLFKGKELSFAFSINLAIARLGTAAALILSPILIETTTGWTLALWVAALLMGMGLIFFIVYMAYDKKYTPAEREGSLLDADERFKMSDIVGLLKNKSFILISLLCVTFYSAVFPFQAYCPDFLHNKFGVTLKMSGMLSSLIIWGTIVFTPIFGYFVDKKGKRATLMFYGSGMLLIAHLVLSLTFLTPYVAMFIIGIGFSLVPAAMWPGVARIVEEKRLGTAYGIMTSIQNLGLFVFPILAGAITDAVNKDITPEMLKQGATLDYTYTILMFAGLGLLGFLYAYFLKRDDGKNPDHPLEMPEMGD
jgi:MFS family permease